MNHLLRILVRSGYLLFYLVNIKEERALFKPNYDTRNNILVIINCDLSVQFWLEPVYEDNNGTISAPSIPKVDSYLKTNWC